MEFKWIPEPSTALPGAVAGPVKGLASLKDIKAAFSMPASGPMYKVAPEWFWKDIDIVVVDYLTDAKSAAAFLPEGMTTLPIVELPGYSAVKQVWAHYRHSSFGPYHKFFVVIPALHQGQMSLFNPLMYVDRDSAMAVCRAIGDWPKKMGDIRMQRSGNEYRLSFSRNGQQQWRPCRAVSISTARRSSRASRRWASSVRADRCDSGCMVSVACSDGAICRSGEA